MLCISPCLLFPSTTDVYETEVFSWVTNPDSLSSSILVEILTGCEIYYVCELCFLPSPKMVL